MGFQACRTYYAHIHFRRGEIDFAFQSVPDQVKKSSESTAKEIIAIIAIIIVLWGYCKDWRPFAFVNITAFLEVRIVFGQKRRHFFYACVCVVLVVIVVVVVRKKIRLGVWICEIHDNRNCRHSNDQHNH